MNILSSVSHVMLTHGGGRRGKACSPLQALQALQPLGLMVVYWLMLNSRWVYSMKVNKTHLGTEIRISVRSRKCCIFQAKNMIRLRKNHWYMC